MQRRPPIAAAGGSIYLMGTIWQSLTWTGDDTPGVQREMARPGV
jgi:hypothetical protein